MLKIISNTMRKVQRVPVTIALIKYSYWTNEATIESLAQRSKSSSFYSFFSILKKVLNKIGNFLNSLVFSIIFYAVLNFPDFSRKFKKILKIKKNT